MRIVALWLLATWCAECVWGGFTVAGYPVAVVFLGPLYGSVAVLIREVARRRGGGWPSMVLLAAAFGLVQAGLVDMALFDREALAGTQFAEQGVAARATSVPVLGFSVEQLWDFVGNHVWLSVCAPIAVVEACTRPEVRRAPWLSGRTAGLFVVSYVAGSLLIRSDMSFTPSPVQVVFVLVAVVVLVVAAVFWRPSPPRAVSGPGPLVLGGVVLSAQVGSWFFGAQWLGMGLRLVTLLLVVALVVRWARSEAHVLAAWGAGLVAAAGGAFLSPPYDPAPVWLMVLSDVVGAVFVVALLGWGCHRLRGGRGPGPTSRATV